MIAANFLKHPDAMALQLPLPFGTVLKWATKRPGSRVLRAIRAARGRAFAAAGRIKRPEPQAKPVWWTAFKKRAHSFAEALRAALQSLF